ncbi:MAG: hydrogenase maturation protease [Chloroflexota bacterium]|nr:hydrogenase maturation protease [Chloroflexota bacterium]
MTPRVLVAGMGNDLCRDDGFGIVAVRRFAETAMPEGVKAYEAGIGGIGLIQELMDGYEALVIVDAVDRGGKPGTVYLLETQVPKTEDLSTESRQGFVADMHYTVPSKALTLAQALDVLPPRVYILGCEPQDCGLGMELSEPVEAGIAEAVGILRELTIQLTSGCVPA